jgi:hypothetical protein
MFEMTTIHLHAQLCSTRNKLFVVALVIISSVTETKAS